MRISDWSADLCSSDLSIYSNFTEGLTRGTVVGATYANAGEVLNPYQSKQSEAGVKVDWGRVTTTMAYYQLARPRSEERRVGKECGLRCSTRCSLNQYKEKILQTVHIISINKLS